MNWEALSAIATAFTGLVIMFTVIVGMQQARVALQQINETHRATQLDGMMRIFEKFDDERFIRARQYINTELAARMAQPDFEDYLRATPATEYPWMAALGTLERMGVFVKMGLLEGEPFYYHWGNMIIGTTRRLRPFIDLQRKLQDNPYLWKDTEWMAADCETFVRRLIAEDPRNRPSTGEIFTLDAFETGSR
jgi:hypothetical protein